MRRVFVLVMLAALLLSARWTTPATATHVEGPEIVYFPQTEHTVHSGFLDFWRHSGGVEVLGYPLTEELVVDGLTVQFFERAVLEWHPDAPQEGRVQLRHLGTQAAQARMSEAAFQRVEKGIDTPAEGYYFAETGHHLAGDFHDFWIANGGLRSFGYPISEGLREDGLTVQYFERAVFEWHPDAPIEWRVQLRHLGATAAQEAGVQLASVERRQDIQDYAPELWATVEPRQAPRVAGPPDGAPQGLAKWIEIDRSDQYLRAWEGDTAVWGTFVSTGIEGKETPEGTFEIFYKLREDDMQEGRAGSEEFYDVPNVPHTMYFKEDGYAIHGTYWHTSFGTPMSHGCVNLPLREAAWLYTWAPHGTTVWVHE